MTPHGASAMNPNRSAKTFPETPFNHHDLLINDRSKSRAISIKRKTDTTGKDDEADLFGIGRQP